MSKPSKIGIKTSMRMIFPEGRRFRSFFILEFANWSIDLDFLADYSIHEYPSIKSSQTIWLTYQMANSILLMPFHRSRTVQLPRTEYAILSMSFPNAIPNSFSLWQNHKVWIYPAIVLEKKSSYMGPGNNKSNFIAIMIIIQCYTLCHEQYYLILY